MPASKEIDGSESVLAFYGAELRYKREQAGLTLKEVVKDCYFSVSYLSEIERGYRRMPRELAPHVDRVLGTDGFFARRCDDVRRSRGGGYAHYFERALEAEERATGIEEWYPGLVPGLLQTAPYARAMVLGAHPLSTEEEVEEKVSARLKRAQLLEVDHKNPAFWMVLHESVLSQPLLPLDEMAEQLNHIAELGRRRRIVPQILPCNSGPHPLMMGSVKAMRFRDEPPLIYIESAYSGDTIDDPEIVDQYLKAYDLVRAAALPPAASLSMIQATAEDFRNGKQRN
ncbi:helix-turn-helix domain-containing protein [Streptomyces sp. NPDC014733]|uniref:helix-turn-helix domain-containing protein n=1 Tax=Streptomyces sp. NPDC014733 TaxID=3364885 RepID=UPI0036FD5455